MDFSEHIDNLRHEGNYRELPRMTTGDVIDFSTNDYLGLGGDSELQASFFADPASLKVPMTSSASRLLASRQIEYDNLEVALRLLYSKRRGDDTGALLFNSGYHANTGLIPAVASKGTYIIADRLVHASIIDGIVLSKAPFSRFRHNDYGHLRELLAKHSPDHKNILVIVESVYSMDGDSADLETLCALKSRFPKSILYIDEAHAFGAVGVSGLGLCRGLQTFPEIDVIVGTFGKACASAGAFAITTPTLRDYAVNRARSFIFSTAIPPITCAWTRFMIEQIVGMETERQHLRSLSGRLAANLGQDSPRYITPVIIGSSNEAIRISTQLIDEGIKVLPIRTPTVPPGTERLRISLSAAMALEQIDRLTDALKSAINQ